MAKNPKRTDNERMFKMKKLRYDIKDGVLGCCGSDKAPLKVGGFFDKWHSDGYKYIARWEQSRISDSVKVDTK